MRDWILGIMEKVFGPVDPCGNALVARWERDRMPRANKWERIEFHAWGDDAAHCLHRFLDRLEYDHAKAELGRRQLMRDIMRGAQ